MKVAVVGTGSIGSRHIDNIAALDPDLQLILVREGARKDDFSADRGARVVADIEAAIALGPDLVVIASPSACHARTLLPVLAAGLAVYVEKPIVTRREDLDALLRIEDPDLRAVPSMTGCNFRFLPSLRLLRERIREHALGNVVRMQMSAGQWLPDWRPQRDYKSVYSASPALGGGVIFDLIHELDLACWLFGGFDTVDARAGTFSGLEIGVEDTACIVLSRAGGPLVSISLDYVARSRIRRYECVGDEATAVWDLGAGTLVLERESGRTGLDCGADGFDVQATYPAAMQEFLESVRCGRPGANTLWDGLHSVELAIRARECAGLQA